MLLTIFIAVFFGLGTLRVWRKRAWNAQIRAGDAIAIKKGPKAIVKRVVKKQVIKVVGKRINLIKKLRG